MVMQRPERIQTGTEIIEKMREVRDFVDAHATEERRQSLADTYGNTIPIPNHSVYFALYQHAIACALREIVEGLATATAPKKRGRPRKDGEPDATSKDTAMDATSKDAGNKDAGQGASYVPIVRPRDTAAFDPFTGVMSNDNH